MEVEQNNNDEQEIDELRKELARLKEDIDETYYRIPKQEFENITVRKIAAEVTDHVDKRINLMRNWIGGLIVVLSFFGYTQWSGMTEGLQTEIKEDIERTKNQFRSDNEKEINDRFVDIEQRLQNRLKLIEINQEAVRESLSNDMERFPKIVNETALIAARNETERQLKDVRDVLLIAKKNVWEGDLNRINEEITRTRDYADALKKLNPIIEKVVLVKDQLFVNKFLDKLFLWTFYNREYERMDKLRYRYENDFNFNENTWANIAIAGMYLYQETYAPIYKKRVVSAISESLEKLPSYGIPYAIRLVVNMIDYQRQPSEAQKQAELEDARGHLLAINSGSWNVTAYEAYNHLLILQEDKKVGFYVDDLLILFPQQMANMKKKYDAYFQEKQNTTVEDKGA